MPLRTPATHLSRPALPDGRDPIPVARGRVPGDPIDGAPATVWAPPPAAVGDRWRAWVLTAIDRAFLPAHGRRIDLTEHLVTDPHGQRRRRRRTPTRLTASVRSAIGAAGAGDALLGGADPDQPATSAITASPPTADSVPRPSDPDRSGRGRSGSGALAPTTSPTPIASLTSSSWISTARRR